jgi:acetylornithine deacetylase/succinyl-diaminopimelate desuccinylase-like protein
MRAAHKALRDRLGAAIVLEGIGVSRVYNAGLGVRRLRISVEGPGGHSWLHSGRPSAIHHMLQLGARLVNELDLPDQRRSTFNVGLIEGGQSINTRAPHASLSIDLRSTESETLNQIEEQIEALIAQSPAGPDLTVQSQVIGERPCAALSDQHPLVRAAVTTLEMLGFDNVQPEMGSTDANILLAENLPAVCIGITSGGNAHSAEEFIETALIPAGMAQLTLLTLAAAENSSAWRTWM